MSNSKTAKPLMFLMGANITLAGLSYFLTISLANFFGPTQFGVYSEILILGALLSLLIKFGTEQTATARFVRLANSSQVFSNVYTIKLLTFILCVTGLFFFQAPNYIVISCVILVALKNFDLSFYYEIKQKNERYSVISLIEKLVYVAGALTLIFFGYSELLGYFLLLGVLTLLGLIFQLIDAQHYKDFKLSKCTQGLFTYIKESIPVTVVALSAFAFGGLSRLILEQKLGSEALGIYSLGWQLVAIGTIFVSVVYRIWRFRFAEAINSAEISILLYHLRTYTLFTILPLIILCLVIGLNADNIVRLLFTEEYISLSELLPLFAVYIFLISIAGLLEMLWVATGKTTVSMVINVSFSVFLLIVLSQFSDGFGMKEFLTSSILVHFGLILTLAIVWWFKFKRLFTR
tara:strand:+ start:108 stop:1322 length:1215 start_codon:yes stop_codon:yes gene_type:complete